MILLFLAVVSTFYLAGGQQYLSWDYFTTQRNTLQAWVGQHTTLAVLLYFTIYVLATTFSLPAAGILTLIGGALFGRWLGTGIVSIASTIGATLAFLSSRYLLRDWVRTRLGNKLAKLDAGIARDGAFYLYMLRMIPLFPFFLINIGMGLTSIRTRPFMIASWAGMLPGTFLFVNAGAELGSAATPKDLWSARTVLAFVALALFPLVVKYLFRSRTTPSGDGK